jgi:glycine/D-amino acid oxidase-like deaminating enzyme
VHWGEEGVEATNRLVAVAEAANDAEAANNNNSDDKQLPPPTQIVVRDQLYRLAVTDKHVEQLQATARNSTLAQYCTWKTTDELIQAGVITSTEVAAGAFDETETTVLGALCLHSGCCLLHVPSYLQGLWAACRGRGATWEIVGNDEMNNVADWKKRLQDFDAVVLSAGSGLFSTPTHKKDSGTNSTSSSLLSRSDFPLQLVRGQSVEIRVPDHVHEDDDVPSQALLCGKYVSPMPGDPNLYLVGATHEFQEDALSGTAVKAELQKLTEQFSSRLWKNATVERWTSGYRVQSERGQLGRLPMIGRLATTSTDDADTNTQIHTNVWIFTGLSSRGLLYHALYGDILTDALLAGSEAPMLRRGKELTWWKKKLNSGGIR